MKNKAEIAAEIAALEACKTYIPHRTYFGEDNHARVDLQIEVLRGEIDVTAEEFNDYSEEQQSEILAAHDWMNGDRDESPSSDWDSYKPKAKEAK